MSWSSLDLYERSPKRWVELYVRGQEVHFNKNGQAGIDLGRKLATALESKDLSGDPTIDLTIKRMPRFERFEVELSPTLQQGKGENGIPLLGRVDNATPDLSGFKEYKQGTTAWTQAKADSHGQITFYSMMIYLTNGKLPTDIELVWMPTERRPDGSTELIGDVHVFKTQRTMADVLRMMLRVRKAWAGMERLTNEELLIT